MPKWLGPWLVSVALLIGVALALVMRRKSGIDATLVGAGAIVVVAAGFTLRFLYLKKNPPDPELTHKPFWRF